MKICTKCNIEKSLDDFYNNRARKDGKHPQCKVCHGKAVAAYEQTEKGKAVKRKYNKKYNQTEKRKACRRKYEQSEKGKATKRKTAAKRISTPAGRLKNSLSTGLWHVMKGKKVMKTMEYVGCSVEQFQIWMHNQLKMYYPQWTLDDYGAKWEIDHIRPISSFDHNDPEQVKACWVFTNLRPLCISQNRSEGARR